MSNSFEEDYIVEGLRDIRKLKGAADHEILVKWEGYDSDQCTWELVSNLQHLEDDLGVQRDLMVEEFIIKSTRRKKPETKESPSVASVKRRKVSEEQTSTDSKTKKNLTKTKAGTKNTAKPAKPVKEVVKSPPKSSPRNRGKAVTPENSKISDETAESGAKSETRSIRLAARQAKINADSTNEVKRKKSVDRDMKEISAEDMKTEDGNMMLEAIHGGYADVVSLVRGDKGFLIKVKRVQPWGVNIWLPTCDQYRGYYSNPPKERDISAEKSLSNYLLKRVRFHNGERKNSRSK